MEQHFAYVTLELSTYLNLRVDVVPYHDHRIYLPFNFHCLHFVNSKKYKSFANINKPITKALLYKLTLQSKGNTIEFSNCKDPNRLYRDFDACSIIYYKTK